VDTVKIVKLIRTDMTRRGEGVEHDPVRMVIQYWDEDGNLVLEYDTHTHEAYVNPMYI
jgi:hypothetical protein